MPDIPALETGRLTLRGHTLDDFDESAEMWADPAVVRHIGGRPFTGEETWSRLLRNVGLWSLMGFGYWVVREKSTGRFVGEVGFAELRRDIEPSLVGVPEAGWVLDPGSHGRGLATEAVRAVLEWSGRRFRWPKTACLIHPENAASLRVAEKCGYRESARSTYRDQPIFILERPSAT